MEIKEPIINETSPFLNVDITKIRFDFNNPRGETAEQILEDKSFTILKESIRENGILEPLKVRKEGEDYILIDGERRLRALIDLKEQLAPVIINYDVKDSKILAYQIHMNRKPWSKPAEIKSIKGIIQEIRTEQPDISDTELKKELMNFTNHTAAAIADFMCLANYSNEIFDEINSNPKGKLGHSYLVQIESSFMNPLRRNYPLIITKLGEDQIRSIMVDKVRKGLMVSSRYLMDTFKKVFQDTNHKDQIEKLITEFLSIKNQSIRAAYGNYDSIIKEEQRIEKEKSKIPIKSNLEEKSESKNDIQNTTTSSKKDPENPLSSGNKLKPVTIDNKENHKDLTPQPIIPLSCDDLKKKYEKIGKTFSSDEAKYIEEAIFCLETGRCYKAATLMLWATAVSRTLLYINKDIPLFNSTCESMKKTPKNFYTHYSKNFQTSASTIVDIRESSKDMQLICYICYVGCINDHELKKLKGHYDLRNDCAHPTGVEIGANEVYTMFENIYNLILNNPKLK